MLLVVNVIMLLFVNTILLLLVNTILLLFVIIISLLFVHISAVQLTRKVKLPMVQIIDQLKWQHPCFDVGEVNIQQQHQRIP